MKNIILLFFIFIKATIPTQAQETERTPFKYETKLSCQFSNNNFMCKRNGNITEFIYEFIKGVGDEATYSLLPNSTQLQAQRQIVSHTYKNINMGHPIIKYMIQIKCYFVKESVLCKPHHCKRDKRRHTDELRLLSEEDEYIVPVII